jgi:hypothetical protein
MIYGEKLLASRPAPKLEDHPLLTVVPFQEVCLT